MLRITVGSQSRTFCQALHVGGGDQVHLAERLVLHELVAHGRLLAGPGLVQQLAQLCHLLSARDVHVRWHADLEGFFLIGQDSVRHAELSVVGTFDCVTICPAAVSLSASQHLTSQGGSLSWLISHGVNLLACNQPANIRDNGQWPSENPLCAQQGQAARACASSDSLSTLYSSLSALRVSSRDVANMTAASVSRPAHSRSAAARTWHAWS